jgi:GlcNAc-P-P-Und epimerase
VRYTLLTGASGFLGQRIHRALAKTGQVISLGRGTDANIRTDLAREIPTLPDSYDQVVHAAGLAHSRPHNWQQEHEFSQVNLNGTLRLLLALDECDKYPSSFVYISSASVYGLTEGQDIDEDAPLLGKSPYALSKIAAEEAILNWTEIRGIRCVILRPALMVGQGAPGSLADLRRAILGGYYVRIRGNEARKSVVLADDVAELVPRLYDEEGVFNISDGQHAVFHEIENQVAAALGKQIRWSVGKEVLQVPARVGDLLQKLRLPYLLNSERLKQMSETLTFSDARAREYLDWKPRFVMEAGHPDQWLG